VLGYMTIGANDLAASTRFYQAILPPLGYEAKEGESYTRFSLIGVADKDNGPCTIYIQKPFDGEPARPGNGIMPAFGASTPSGVQAFYEAALANGGSDEGAPGTRPYYSPEFYVAYVRDPAGNKLAAFCILENK
jgi:catechol 2,3-dioxygenase-like lactoylglutathione lyase family enzyme